MFQVLSRDSSGKAWHVYQVDLEGNGGRGECSCEGYQFSPHKNTRWYACKHMTYLFKVFFLVGYRKLSPEIMKELWSLAEIPDAESEKFQEAVRKRRASIKVGRGFF